MNRFSPVSLLSACALFLLLGCQAKEKPEKPIQGAGLMPPWDSTKYLPKQLEGFVYAGPESLFTVFSEISRLDAVGGDRKDWKPDPQAVDTVRINQLFDSAFVFPPVPEASMPYAYDDSYRDDTLYRNYFGAGLFTQDHPCASTFVLSGTFQHPAKWLKTGLNEARLLETLGRPAYRQPGVLRYVARRSSPPPDTGDEASGDGTSRNGPSPYAAFDVFEGVNFYFLQDSLFAAVLQRSQPCH